MAPDGLKGASAVLTTTNRESKFYNKMAHEELAWKYLTLKKLAFTLLISASGLSYYFSLPFYLFPLLVAILFIPAFCGLIGCYNIIYALFFERKNKASKIDEFLIFKNEKEKERHAGKFIAIRDLYELYADGQIDFKMDVLESLNNRDGFVSYKLQWWHLKFFLTKFVPEMLHFKTQDKEQVCDHYDRGNDFYASFLGPMMIYTSGIMHSIDDSLEEMQRNKLEAVFKKINLKPAERLLDIGCGWGTLVNYAAEKFGAKGTGVSIAQEQIDWARSNIKPKASLEGEATFKCSDYRDIPSEKYNKITCLEMAEHVGVRLFPSFLKQVSDMLEDDGIFFLQIAGLRRAWQWEDFLWGFFMDTYIFPGADASLPLTFPVAQLEAAGFEVQSVETVGIHYSETIKRWYYNWIKPDHKERVVKKYGERLYRVWEIFLAWSTIIARQGNSTCYQIVAHKNLNGFPRPQFIRPKAKDKSL